VSRGLFFDGCTLAEIESWQTRFIYFLRKLSLHQERRPLLIKNPVYTGRLAMLRELFPEARFVHIHRNPYEVFLSMRNFYARLFEEFALQSHAHVDIDETILTVYERLMSALERDAAGMTSDRFVELRYAELDADPLGAVAAVYERLGLGGFEAGRPAFETYLASVRTFEKNKFVCSDEVAAKVESRLGRYLAKWAYVRPGGAADAGEGKGHAGEVAGAA
jgi:hypothetical protein